MNRATFLEFHKAATETMHEICQAKNADYAGQRGGEDAFANFRVVESYGIASTEQGILTRMSDKMARLATFSQTGKLAVADESVTDTLLDLANYAIILAAYLDDKSGATSNELAVSAEQERAAFLAIANNIVEQSTVGNLYEVQGDKLVRVK